MKRIKYVFGFIFIMIYFIDGYHTTNEIILKRVRRIIRGHLAKPGQVNN